MSQFSQYKNATLILPRLFIDTNNMIDNGKTTNLCIVRQLLPLRLVLPQLAATHRVELHLPTAL